MDRRQLFGLAAATAFGAGACSLAPEPSSAQPAAPAGRKPSGLRLGCQSGPSTEEHFAYFARYGVKNICASPQIDDPARLYPTVDELKRMKDLAGKHGVSVDLTDSVLLRSTHIDREPNPSIMMASSPQRDRDIEAFQNLIRNCAAAGIPAVKYNMSILGVLRNFDEVGRGGAIYHGWDMAAAKPDKPLTRAGVVNADAFWERITYFLDRVVPVANEHRIRIACHPQDPGVSPEGYQGVDRVLGTVDGLKKFIAIRESEYHGLNFCQGTVSENLADPSREIFDVIRYFGTRKKIFNVHFRNIRGRRDKFVETFPDDGDVDMYRAMMTYKEVGYEGMLMPDHVPTLPLPGDNPAYAYNFGGPPRTDDGRLEGFAFAYGYIRGLIQAVENVA